MSSDITFHKQEVGRSFHHYYLKDSSELKDKADLAYLLKKCPLLLFCKLFSKKEHQSVTERLTDWKNWWTFKTSHNQSRTDITHGNLDRFRAAIANGVDNRPS